MYQIILKMYYLKLMNANDIALAKVKYYVLHSRIPQYFNKIISDPLGAEIRLYRLNR